MKLVEGGVAERTVCALIFRAGSSISDYSFTSSLSHETRRQ